MFHLAAAKDAPEGEVDPETTFRVNALGTQHVLDRWPYARVILASTCKACDPETVYGASKLIAERLVLNAGGWVARFHNVRETRGNVFQQWAALPADASLPVTRCYRYFISIDQAVDLLLTVPRLPSGRYMTDPGRLRSMSDVAAETYPDRPQHWITRRRGDRAVEPLHASHERLSFGWADDDIWQIRSHHD